MCRCKKGFLFIKDDCLKEGNPKTKNYSLKKQTSHFHFCVFFQTATDYNEECIDTEQCKPLLGDLGKCVDSKCACEDHLQYNKGKCYEKRGMIK